jgi:hypothetical protein
MEENFLQQSQSKSPCPTAKLYMGKGKNNPLKSKSDAHLASPCLMQSTSKDPLIMPQNARHHLINIEKVHGVQSKMHPQKYISCLSGTPAKSVQSLSGA